MADGFLFSFAVRTGLEPATHGVTGRYSNQLNYRTNCKTSCKIKLIFNSTKYFMKIFIVFILLLCFDTKIQDSDY